MTKMSDLLAGYDDRALARHGDPARYRKRVNEFLSLYDRLLGGEEFSDEFARLWLDALTRVGTNLVNADAKAVAEAKLAVMRAELPCYDKVAEQFAKDMDRLFNHEERTSDNLSDLQTSALFEMARIKNTKGWFSRLGDAEWRLAKEMFNFSAERLKAIWDEAHPKPQIIQQVQVVQAPAPVQQFVAPVPSGRW